MSRIRGLAPSVEMPARPWGAVWHQCPHLWPSPLALDFTARCWLLGLDSNQQPSG